MQPIGPSSFPLQKKLLLHHHSPLLQQYMLYMYKLLLLVDNACLLGFIYYMYTYYTIHTLLHLRWNVGQQQFLQQQHHFFIRENYSTSVAYSEFMRRNDQKSEHISILDRNNGKLVSYVYALVWSEKKKQTHFFEQAWLVLLPYLTIMRSFFSSLEQRLPSEINRFFFCSDLYCQLLLCY